MNSKAHKLLSKIYNDLKSTAAFSEAYNLWREIKRQLPSITKKEFQSWLESHRTYTLHKPVRRKFKKNKIIVESNDEQWQADLVDLQEFAKSNDDYMYIITIIDVYSKYAWVVPIKNQSGDHVVKAFSKILKHRTPEKLQTGKGKKFYNTEFKKFLQEHNVKHFSRENSEIKFAVVKRFNRTFKNKMFCYFTFKNSKKYLNVIDDLVKAYNNTYHRTIKCKPVT